MLNGQGRLLYKPSPASTTATKNPSHASTTATKNRQWAMGKKKKAPELEAWCWYCDRDFADDKVLLEHQKAKHYRCPFCPRKLNTAGGLTVHLNQVHKAEPTKIENALPGRESFDVEIYGMVGIPEADLAEWRARRGNRQGNGQGASKRPKIEKVALTSEQLKAQLEAHKALMSGKAPPPSAAPSLNPAFLPPPPPANMMGYPTGPPPGFGAPPLPIYNRPPPGFGPPPAAMSPPLPMSAAGLYAGPPPGFDPTLPPPTTSLAPAAPRPYAPIAATPLPAVSPIADPVVPLPSVNPHQEAVKTGAKSRLVYADVTMSPEEKLASTSKYLYVDPDDAQQQTSPTMQYNGQAPQQGGDYGSQPLGPPASLNHSFSGALHAQSYPAISEGGKGGIEPASHNPEANTAEALARANEGVGSGLQREIDMGQMEAQAKVSREEGTGLSPEPVGVTELASSQSSTNLNGPRTGRARAADLF